MPHALPADGHLEHYEAQCRNEAWCVQHLFMLRWPGRFICPCCGHSSAPQPPAVRVVCPCCGVVCSITAGTLLHGIKKPLSAWMQAIWWLCSTTRPLTIKSLRRQLRLNSSQTAWRWMRHLRLIMKLAGNCQCTGIVEIDAALLCPAAKTGWNKTIVAAVEVNTIGNDTGRTKFAQTGEPTPNLLLHFVHQATAPDTSIVAPDREPFRSLTMKDRIYMVESGCIDQERAQQMIAGFRAFFNTVPGPKRSPQRLQDALDEYGFRVNIARCPDQQKAFDELLAMIMHVRPASRHASGRNSGNRGGRP